MLLCGTLTQRTQTVDGANNTIALYLLEASSSCAVDVTAVFGNTTSNTITSLTNTTAITVNKGIHCLHLEPMT